MLGVAWLNWSDLEETELLAGVKDGTADLVTAEGEVDDGKRDGRRRDEQFVGRDRGDQLLWSRAGSC